MELTQARYAEIDAELQAMEQRIRLLAEELNEVKAEKEGIPYLGMRLAAAYIARARILLDEDQGSQNLLKSARRK